MEGTAKTYLFNLVTLNLGKQVLQRGQDTCTKSFT